VVLSHNAVDRGEDVMGCYRQSRLPSESTQVRTRLD